MKKKNEANRSSFPALNWSQPPLAAASVENVRASESASEDNCFSYWSVALPVMYKTRTSGGAVTSSVVALLKKDSNEAGWTPA